MLLAETTLHQLLARGESSRLKVSARAVRASFKDPASSYWALSVDQRDQLHRVFQRAASAGAVELTWSRFGGDDRPLEYVQLKNLDSLASFLGVTTLSNALSSARNHLQPWSDNPRVVEIIAAWTQLKKVRAMGPESAPDFADALRIVSAAVDSAEDQLVRPLSVALFGNSKRIEALFTHLDVLTADSLAARPRHWSEVLASIGVRKDPQPLLIAGHGTLCLRSGPLIPIAEPFVGIASHALTAYRGSPSWLLTVENLTTFHQCAALVSGRGSGLVIYTAGMPSPSWLKGYSSLVSSTDEATPVFHWGDHDEGGFRIAIPLSRVCASHNRKLQPWLMNPTEGIDASEAQFRAMRANAHAAGWSDLTLKMRPVLVEQESQAPVLPTFI